MKTYIVILILILISANNLSAQKTVEKIGKAAEVINTTGNVIKSFGGLFGKKNKKTDSLRKVDAAAKSVGSKNGEIAISTSDAKIIDKSFVAKTLFGKQKTELDMLWKANIDEKIDEELVSQLLSDDGYYHTVVKQLIEFEEKGVKNVTALLITYNYNKDEKGKLRKNEGRASSPGIGFANFVKTEDGNWQLTKVNRLTNRVGSNGEVPSFEIINLGNSLNTMSFTDSYGMGGQNETHQTFYALNADYLGKRILDIALLESWEGGYTKNNPAYEIKRTYKILEDSTTDDYPNILVGEVKNKKPQQAVVYTFSKEKAEYIKNVKPVVAKTGTKKGAIKKVTSTSAKKATSTSVKPKPTVKTASTPGIKKY